MAHIQASFQKCAGFGWQGGAEFMTQVVQLQSGRERRNAMWAEGRHRYTAPFLNISKEAYREIKRLHMVCRGQLHAFQFRDELDYESDQETFAIGDGTKDTFQLAKVSLIDGIQYNRNVYCIDGPIVVRVNGVVTSAYTLDPLRGIIVFDEPPAADAVLDWTGNFFVWVRFAQDFLPFTLDNRNATNGTVDLIEVPAPEPEE